MEMSNGTVTVKYSRSLEIPQTVQHRADIWLHNFTPSVITKRNENIDPHSHKACIHTQMFTATLLIIAKKYKQPKLKT